MDKLAFLFVEGNVDGCNFYRIRQPAIKLIERENLVCAVSQSLKTEDLEFWIDRADVIVTQKASAKFLSFIKDKKPNQKIVFDSDDNVFCVSPYNPGYQYWGYKEVDYRVENGSIIKLRDGNNGFSIEENKKRLAIFKSTVEMADLVITPSPVLSGFYKRWNKNVKTFPNLINFNVWNPVNICKDDWVRIGYQCGWSHYEDFWEVQEALKHVMEHNKNVKLVLMGQAYKGAMAGFDEDRIEVHSWVGMEAYPYKMKSLNLDIGIAPLINNEFNNCKSEVKWEEYSALKIPTVASNVVPYSLRIRDKDTGFLCSSKDEWISVLNSLIENKNLRDNTARLAHNYVRENYDLDSKIEDYERILSSLFKPELILA